MLSSSRRIIAISAPKCQNVAKSRSWAILYNSLPRSRQFSSFRASSRGSVLLSSTNINTNTTFVHTAQQQRFYSSSLPDGAQFIEMSALSPTMEQGNLIKWVKKEGDKIEPGDALCSVQTDKAVMDMEYQEEGYLAKILVEGGTDSVEIGRPIAIFVEEEEDIAKVKDFTLDGGAAPAKEVESQQEEPQQRVEQPAQQQQQQAAPAQKQSGDRLKASPYAKTLAKERGVDLNQIAQGSGPEGRIVASDVEKFTPGAQPAQPQQKAAATTAAPAAMAAPVSQDFQDVPVSQVRRVIAERLLESKRTIPHYYLTVECEMDELLRIRSLLNKRFEKEGVKLSVNDFILKAAALAAKAVPEANSSWQGTFIRQYNSVDMSVAVQTDNGLITPIVFDCDKKGLKEISKDVKALAEKARDGKLQPHEFQGGSFTVSNLGMFGIKEFSAIINPPQACILAVGSAQRKVVETPEGGYRTATTINVTLSCDHRVVDGAVGAEFLKVFSRNITDPLNMLA